MPAPATRRARSPQARETDDATRYLGALFARDDPGTWIEVRYRHRDSMRSAFFAPSAIHQAARAIVRQGISTDVYVGVAARRSRHGAKHAITTVATLWADLDTPDARRALGGLPVAPAIVIASGIIRSGLARARCASGDIRRRHVISGARAIRVVSGGDDAR